MNSSKRSQKKIVYITPYIYLGLPQFYSILPKMKNFENIFLNLNDPRINNYVFSLNQKKEISKKFDLYLEIKGIDLPELKSSRTIDGVIYLVKRLHNSFKYKVRLMKFLDRLDPDLIISTSDKTINDKICIRWTEKNNVPFVILQPSFIEGKSNRKIIFKNYLKYFVFNKLLKLPLYNRNVIYGGESDNTHLILWSEKYILEKNRKNTYFTGNPAFDEFFVNFSEERNIKNRVLICTQDLDELYSDEIYKEVINIYRSIFKKYPNTEFVLKIHPRETKEKYMTKYPLNQYENVIIEEERSLIELFKISDVQMSVSSYSSLEAVAFGIPIINVITPRLKSKTKTKFQSIAMEINRSEQIDKVFNLVYSEKYWQFFIEKRKKYLEDLFGKIDGKSSKRVHNKLNNLLKIK